MKVDTIAIRRRARAHWYAKRRTEATLAASFDTYQLLAEIARLERRLTMMQAERAATGDGTAARRAVANLAAAETNRERMRRARREERLRAAVARRAA